MRRLIAPIFVLMIVTVLCQPQHSAFGNADQPAAVAIVVQSEPGHEILAGQLRAIVEAETSARYEGELLEREEMSLLLQEMKLSSLLGAEENAVQTGKFDKAAYLILIKVEKNQVRLVVNSFPKTAVVVEKRYTDRLEIESLNERIITDALTAIRGNDRDPNTPYVSIGSFYVNDPHDRYMEFSRQAEDGLRKSLVESGQVRLMERRFPSDLLKEFNMARGGMTVSRITDFSAPPADILVYAECVPHKEQNLDATNLKLSCTVTVLSPSNLSPRKELTVECGSEDVSPLVDAARKLVEESVGAARELLASGAARGFSEGEFEEFKKQAFRLMISPPAEDGAYYREGSYRGWNQHGQLQGLERALRMLESAQLFKGDDTSILVAASAVLFEIAGRYMADPVKREAILNASLELAERAYNTESNWNTRGFYASISLNNRHPQLMTPRRSLQAAENIWRTRNSEPWNQSSIDAAFVALVRYRENDQSRLKILRTAFRELEKRRNGLRAMMWAMQPLWDHISDKEDKAAILASRMAVGEELRDSPQVFLQAAGLHVMARASLKYYEMTKDANYLTKLVEQYAAAQQRTPQLEVLYGDSFKQSPLPEQLSYVLDQAGFRLIKEGRENEYLQLQVSEIENLLTEPKPQFGAITNQLRKVLPLLEKKNDYARAQSLLEKLLQKYNFGGSGDWERMQFAAAVNVYRAKSGKSKLLALDSLKVVPFSDGVEGAASKLAAAEDSIVGVREARGGFYTGGRAFQLSGLDGKAQVLTEIKEVSDASANQKYFMVGTWKDGIHIINRDDQSQKHLTPENSAIPGKRIRFVTNAGDDFVVGIYDKDTKLEFYRLNPTAGQLTSIDAQISAGIYDQIKVTPDSSKIQVEEWDHLTAEIDGVPATLTAHDTHNAVRKIEVRKGNTESILQYTGVELSHVFQFSKWRNYLVFATGNGLYVSKPGSNEIRCIIAEQDVQFRSFLPVGNSLLLGSSRGLHVLTAQQFDEAVAQ